VETQAVQGIAEDEGIAGAGVEEGFDSEVITSAEKASLPGIPDGEGKITDQVIDAIFAPDLIGAENQFDVWHVVKRLRNVRSEPGNQVAAAVHTGVSDDPGVAVQSEGLMLVLGLDRRLQKRMAEANLTMAPDPLRVWPAKSKGVRQPSQQDAVDRGPVEI
jgi:hypothetical protein